MPFCTGSVLEVENEVLLAAFGLLLPGLMHEAVPESTATIWASPPRPASFAWTVRVFPETVTVGELTKCGLPADAGSARASVANSVLRSAPVIVRSRRMTPPCVWVPVRDPLVPARHIVRQASIPIRPAQSRNNAYNGSLRITASD